MLALMKFSESMDMLGTSRRAVVSAVITAIHVRLSFTKKTGLNRVLFADSIARVGLLEPFECKITKWSATAAASIRGAKKCTV